MISAPHVIEFCQSLVSGQKPVTVSCQPLVDKPLNECFTIVPEHIANFGGEQVIGWAIWERPGVFIEGEFHAVWRNQAGELADIVPRPIPFSAITFLPDPNAKYIGRQVDNTRKALVKDHDISKFLFLAKRRFEIMNTGDLADKHGNVALPEKIGREYIKVVKELVRLEKRIAARYPTKSE